MSVEANTNECSPLMEACTLSLYERNIFRVTGLPVDATSKEVSRQAQKLQMLAEIGGGEGTQSSFDLAVPPTTDQIRAALSRMKQPEQRIVDEFFWFWPEEFGSSKADPAIQAVLSGDTDTAANLWREREKDGSHVAQHNMAIMYHLAAVVWTNHHVSSEIDKAREDQIKEYWRKSFERWEKLVDEDELWDMLKERVRSQEDEALTTGFVRRMLRELPEALDQVNAEAALKFAEQGRLDWAKFHVAFMRETHQGLDDVDSTSEMVLQPTKRRVEQHLESFRSQTEEDPQRGAELASQLMERCQPMMELFDLFHGEEAHQRNDLFDQVAETVLTMVIGHQRSTGDNKSFVDLLRKTLSFASGAHLRERIIKNISIGEGNLAHERESNGTAICFFCGNGQGSEKKKVSIPMHKIVERSLDGVRYRTNAISVPRCQSCFLSHKRHWKIMCAGAAVCAVVGAFIVPWSAVGGMGVVSILGGGWIALQLAKADGRLGLLGMMFVIGCLSFCGSLSEQEIGRNILLNMLGGAIVGAVITFWTAKKLLNERTPEVLAVAYPKIVSLRSDGWEFGEKP